MKSKSIHILFFRREHLLILSIGLLLSVYIQVAAQDTLIVYQNPTQGLNFGSFIQGTMGGTITISPEGTRSVTGGLIEVNLGSSFSPATFGIEVNASSHIAILNGPDTKLTGSNGGSLALHIGVSNTGSPFITTAVPPSLTEVLIGGTLTAGSALANPPGMYSGSFSVTFIRE